MASEEVTTTGGIDITVNYGEGGAVVHLNGRLSIDSSPALRDRLLAILQTEPPETVIVDLTQTPYIDCSGIATLIEALKVARNQKIRLRLRGLHDRLLHLLRATGVLSLFDGSDQLSSPSIAKVT